MDSGFTEFQNRWTLRGESIEKLVWESYWVHWSWSASPASKSMDSAGGSPLKTYGFDGLGFCLYLYSHLRIDLWLQKHRFSMDSAGGSALTLSWTFKIRINGLRIISSTLDRFRSTCLISLVSPEATLLERMSFLVCLDSPTMSKHDHENVFSKSKPAMKHVAWTIISDI